MTALKIAFAFAVLSPLLFLASAIRPLSTGQPLESTNGTVSTAHHLDVEGFRHVDLSLRRPFRHHGGAHFFGFRIHLGVDGFHHPHHHRHHGDGHGFHGVVVEHEREFKKGYDPAEPSEALTETGEAGVRRKMEAEDEENEVKEWNPSFFHRHSHHFGGHRFHGGWVAKHEELRKIKKMVKKTKEEDSDSDSDADSDAEAEDNDEGKEKGGWLGWFKSIWSQVHRRRCHHHLRLHREHHYLGHRSHRFHGWKVNPEGDETTPRTWLAAHWEDSEGHRHLEKEEDVKEIMEQPELISEEIRSKDSETGAGEPEKEE